MYYSEKVYITARCALNSFYSYSLTQLDTKNEIFFIFLYITFLGISWVDITLFIFYPRFLTINKLLVSLQLGIGMFFNFDIFSRLFCYSFHHGYDCRGFYGDSYLMFASIFSIAILTDIIVGLLIIFGLTHLFMRFLSKNRRYFDRIPITIIPPDDNSCSICLEDENAPDTRWKKLSCNHKFHPHCIDEWFYTLNNNSCPICRNIEPKLSFV